MFAERRKRNVAHHHHLVVAGLESNTKMFTGIALDAREEFVVHLGHASRSFEKAFTGGVFTDCFEEFANELSNPRLVDHVYTSPT
jgi:hypothetical protein